MIVLCTGTSGSGQREYLQKVADVVGEDPIKPRIYDIGDKMQQVAQDSGRPIPDVKLLDIGPVQELLSGWAFERVNSEIRSCPDDAVSIVVAHACFRRRNILYPGFPVACVKLLDPDMVITIVDDIASVRARLNQHRVWSMWCQPTDLSCWREEEILVSLILARFQQAAYYVIPQAEPPITLYNLLYHTSMKKIYLSYPITNIMRDQEKSESYLTELDKLKDTLRQHFIVFDPLSIKDLQIVPENADESVEQALAGQTVARDYMFVDQSDLVVVYYPVHERSLGVAAEMRHAKQFGKTVHAFVEEGSPFLGEFIDRKYGSTDDLITGLLDQ